MGYTKPTTATEAQMRLQDTLARLGPPPSGCSSEEDRLRWMLIQLHRELQEQAQPILDRLRTIEMEKPSQPMFFVPTSFDEATK